MQNQSSYALVGKENGIQFPNNLQQSLDGPVSLKIC
jgi:hypothetical protein